MGTYEADYQSINRFLRHKEKQMEANGNITLLVCTQSTTIRSIAYEAEKSELVVTFKSGYAYRFDGVSKEAWDKFTLAESKGSHFAKEIKTRYTGRRLDVV